MDAPEVVTLIGREHALARALSLTGTPSFVTIRVADSQLFLALMRGKHAVHGFANRDLRAKLAGTSIGLSDDPTRQSAQVSRLLHRLHVYRPPRSTPRPREVAERLASTAAP